MVTCVLGRFRVDHLSVIGILGAVYAALDSWCYGPNDGCGRFVNIDGYPGGRRVGVAVNDSDDSLVFGQEIEVEVEVFSDALVVGEKPRGVGSLVGVWVPCFLLR